MHQLAPSFREKTAPGRRTRPTALTEAAAPTVLASGKWGLGVMINEIYKTL